MLNPSKGNMYEWITHTWNTVKGECPHGCSYCYMHRWGKQKPVRFDEKELKTDLGNGNFIFVGSSCDMFAEDIPEQWIEDTLIHCAEFDNKYLFQTKNPKRIRRILPSESVVCVTIETNMWYPEIMKNSPMPEDRWQESLLIRQPLYITIEPIMQFDVDQMLFWMLELNPEQINIGADSGRNNLPEPTKEEIIKLVDVLRRAGLKVKPKSNLKRLLK